MNTKSILLLGSIALDTIKTKYGVRKELLGGSATYAAISSSPFVKVNLVGIIGDDFPKVGEKILKEKYRNAQDETKNKNFLFSKSVDFIYEVFNFDKEIKSRKFNEILKIVGRNTKINNFFIKIADKGFVF